MSVMGADDFEALMSYVRDRYARSGKAPDVVESLNRHNANVLGHVEEIAAGENLGDEDAQTLKTISILHDAAKADTHLMLHAEAGAEVAAEQLRNLGKSDEFIEIVQRGILCHMGPFPFIEEEAKKYAERTGDHLHFPRPQSTVEQLFYDADMLALMDIDGIEKVVVLRSTTPEFIEEDEREAAAAGGTPRAAAYRSAMQSVQRAADTLFSATARKIAKRLMDEATAHVNQRLAAETAGA
jgi:hypothetical protein